MRKVRCLIAGGGPAGMMLGLLLARAEIDVLVLEKHSDFLRDFRGDTLHPATLEVMHELGLLEALLARPHQKLRTLSAEIGTVRAVIADFSHLPVHAPFIALMPQWDFLDFLLKAARNIPSFDYRMDAEVIDLRHEGGAVTGAVVDLPEGRVEIAADLVVDATGRGSRLTALAGLVKRDLGAPIDVLWFRLPFSAGDEAETGGRFERGRMLVRIFRGAYWQCAYVIPKGSADAVRERGIAAFRSEIELLVPNFAERLGGLESFEDVKLLSVSVDRLESWSANGFLVIGDAAHAMSPVGGVGINLAIQDAVAAANILSGPLRRGSPSAGLLAGVQRRRQLPTRLTQAAQVFIHNRVLMPGMKSQRPLGAPWPVKLFTRFPILRRIPARLVGMGVRPEHVRLQPDRT